jgi:glycosyltransferase involved in cell wall biosynthesis
MRIIALLGIRNEALYLRHCLDNLVSQGMDVVVLDNDSTDESVAIARERLGAGVLDIVRHPYPGHYDWEGILRHKTELCRKYEADWFMHCDADEIRQPPARFRTIAEGVEEAQQQGFNAINFDEFVFLPTSAQERYEGTDYPALMRQYYYFAPRPLRRVNLWKSDVGPVDIVTSAGHWVDFADRRVFPDSFVMRHYIALSLEHAVSKYTRQRVYSEDEIKRLGWHRTRVNLEAGHLRLPMPEQMHTLAGDESFDRSRPLREHLLFPPKAAAAGPAAGR